MKHLLLYSIFILGCQFSSPSAPAEHLVELAQFTNYVASMHVIHILSLPLRGQRDELIPVAFSFIRPGDLADVLDEAEMLRQANLLLLQEIQKLPTQEELRMDWEAERDEG